MRITIDVVSDVEQTLTIGCDALGWVQKGQIKLTLAPAVLGNPRRMAEFLGPLLVELVHEALVDVTPMDRRN